MADESIKITRSFRLTPASVAMLVEAALKSGCSQGEILEACILDSTERVVQRLASQKAERLSQLAEAQQRLGNIPKNPVGRPRKNVTDK